jgi:hypothetical protein
MVDIIIIAATRNEHFFAITQNAINTLHESESENIFNAIIIETFDTENKYTYKNAKKYLFVENTFNYNKCLNFGITKSTANYVGFFNNDVIFHKNWFSKLQKFFTNRIQSLSPSCPIAHKDNQISDFDIGYRVRKHIAGWAIVVTRELINTIRYFDESASFWRSEQYYAEQLKEHGIIHALIRDSFVEHLESKTLHSIEKNLQNQYTKGQYEIVKQKTFNQFSIIMPSFLGNYQNAASNRQAKFLRAVKSVINQSYKDWQLIIVSDGCDDTIALYNKYFARYENIICISIPKQKYLSGSVRQTGIEYAFSEYIIYLDSDDFYGTDHLKIMSENLKQYDWVYYNDLLKYPDTIHVKDVILQIGRSGTSSICHKRLINVSWQGLDGYTHDWRFIEKLLNQSDNYAKLPVDSQYYICHTVNSKLDE